MFGQVVVSFSFFFRPDIISLSHGTRCSYSNDAVMAMSKSAITAVEQSWASPFLAVDFYDICFFISFLLLPSSMSECTFRSYHDKVLKYNLRHETTTSSSHKHNKTHWEGDRSQGPRTPFAIRPFAWSHQFTIASTRISSVNSRSSHHFCAIGFG